MWLLDNSNSFTFTCTCCSTQLKETPSIHESVLSWAYILTKLWKSRWCYAGKDCIEVQIANYNYISLIRPHLVFRQEGLENRPSSMIPNHTDTHHLWYLRANTQTHTICNSCMQSRRRTPSVVHSCDHASSVICPFHTQLSTFHKSLSWLAAIHVFFFYALSVIVDCN